MNDQRPGGLMRRIKGAMMRRVHGMITCREFEEFVLAYLDGHLPRRQARIFEWHMRLCRECREYLAAYRRSIELGTAVMGDDATLPDNVPEDLVTAILAAKES